MCIYIVYIYIERYSTIYIVPVCVVFCARGGVLRVLCVRGGVLCACACCARACCACCARCARCARCVVLRVYTCLCVFSLCLFSTRRHRERAWRKRRRFIITYTHTYTHRIYVYMYIKHSPRMCILYACACAVVLIKYGAAPQFLHPDLQPIEVLLAPLRIIGTPCARHILTLQRDIRFLVPILPRVRAAPALLQRRAGESPFVGEWTDAYPTATAPGTTLFSLITYIGLVQL